MKLACYLVNGSLGPVYEGIYNATIKGTTIVYDGGSLDGLTDKHILLDDSVTPSSMLDSNMITSDRKNSLTKVKTLQEENAELKTRLSDAEDAILALMDLL